jgi:diguanylate cyclase (GGDEF)-like protein
MMGPIETIANIGTISIQNAQHWEKLERLATTDGLTGLHNHRRFKEMLDEAVIATQRYQRPLSMILCDIDHFKQVNDTYGHPMGDEVLKRVSSVLTDLARASDRVCRYGGEEFSIVLPETDPSGATLLAERFRNEIKAQLFVCEGVEFRVTLSLGVCTLPMYAKHRQDLIDKADQALYHAKNTGRDRTVHYGEI